MSMKKKLSFTILALALISLTACQKGLSSSLSNFSSSSSSTSSSKPIGSSSEVTDFSEDTVFALNMNKISEETAQELVNNDLSKYPEKQSKNKRTVIESLKEESHVTVNRSNSTYSIKDIVWTKHSIEKIDATNKWRYSKYINDDVTTYFEEGVSIRHTAGERIEYVKDDFLYTVINDVSYYEGSENEGTYEAYYYKTKYSDNDDNQLLFSVKLKSCTYFNDTKDFSEIDKVLLKNYANSSVYYQADDYSVLERDPKCEYYSSGNKGSFGCLAKDAGNYRFSDLKDYPSMERSDLSTISYQQDYLLNISNYFTYEENYLLKSVSKKRDGTVIRDEKKDGRKKVTEECEVFYPDLSKFEDRGEPPHVYK